MKSVATSEQVKEAETQDVPEQDIHLLDLLIILSKRRKHILRFTIGMAVLATIVVLVLPSRYTAETIILPPNQPSSISSALLGQFGGAGAAGGALASLAGTSLGIKNPSDMYIALFRSRTVEDSLIQRFGLMARYRTKRLSDARAAFESHSTVLLGAKDGLLRITVSDRDPKLAAEIANGYVDEFHKLSANLAITEASQRRLFFQQLLEARGNLTNAEEAMKSTEQSTGVIQIDSQAKALIESASILRAQEVAKEVQIQAMRSFATEDNPELIIAKRQLAALQAQLDKLAGQNSGSEFIVPKGKAPEVGIEYLRKLRDLKYNEAVYELIAKQFEIAKLDEARQGSVIQVADIAVPPDKRSFPRRQITVFLTLLLSFIAACVWCVISERFQRTKNPADRERLDALRATFRSRNGSIL